jgi:chromosome segregation ATPase
MESLRENIDFDKVLMRMSPEEIVEWEEKARSYKQKSLDRRVAELENWKKQATTEIKCLAEENNELKEKNEKFEEQLEVMQESTNKVTDTLLTHGKEKRELDKYISSLVYKELHKDSLKDELFHGHLTSCCKTSICESLNVGAMQWIEVKDLDIAKKLSVKFLNKVTIHSLMRKYADKLNKDYERSKMDNKKESLSLGKARKYELLELLLEEIGGDLYEI